MTERRLTILQINDLHGYLEPHPEAFRGRGKFNYRTCGGLARIASIFKRVRAERPGEVLALDNGDTFHGTFVAGQSRGEAMLPLMNAREFDAMTLHWEFAYGPAQVRKLAARLTYPALAINIYDKASDRLVFDPSCVIERGGLRIGIVGIASNIVDKSMPPSYSEGVRFTLGNTELPGHIERLRSSEKVDLVVVLSHLGFAQDAKLAAEVSGIDALISGHTHNRLYRPAWVGSTPIIQSGCHGSFVGRLDLWVDGGKVVDVRHELICVEEQIEPDAEMAKRVEEAVAPHRVFLDQVVGQVHSPLDRATSLEASMDNVLLDVIAAAAGTRLAFSNGWRRDDGALVEHRAHTSADLHRRTHRRRTSRDARSQPGTHLLARPVLPDGWLRQTLPQVEPVLQDGEPEGPAHRRPAGRRRADPAGPHLPRCDAGRARRTEEVRQQAAEDRDRCDRVLTAVVRTRQPGSRQPARLRGGRLGR